MYCTYLWRWTSLESELSSCGYRRVCVWVYGITELWCTQYHTCTYLSGLGRGHQIATKCCVCLLNWMEKEQSYSEAWSKVIWLVRWERERESVCERERLTQRSTVAQITEIILCSNSQWALSKNTGHVTLHVDIEQSYHILQPVTTQYLSGGKRLLSLARESACKVYRPTKICIQCKASTDDATYLFTQTGLSKEKWSQGF